MELLGDLSDCRFRRRCRKSAKFDLQLTVVDAGGGGRRAACGDADVVDVCDGFVRRVDGCFVCGAVRFGFSPKRWWRIRLIRLSGMWSCSDEDERSQVLDGWSMITVHELKPEVDTTLLLDGFVAQVAGDAGHVDWRWCSRIAVSDVCGV